MRRSLSLLLSFILLFSLAACGADAPLEETAPPQETAQAAAPEIPEPEPEHSWWENISWFMKGLFA